MTQRSGYVLSFLLSKNGNFVPRCCRVQLQQPGETILKQDSQGCNALHHAIRNGHRQFALELIAAEPALSHAVNKYDESPMFMAVMRNYEDVFNNLLEISDSADGGILGHNALHAAARNGNSGKSCRVSYSLIPSLIIRNGLFGFIGFNPSREW